MQVMSRNSQSVPVVLPFPVSPDATAREVEHVDPVPRWCVRRFPAVGSDAVTVAALDGQGYPLFISVVKLALAEQVEAFAQRLVDEMSGQPSRRSFLSFPPPLRGDSLP